MTPWSGYYEAGQLGDGMGGSQNGAAIWTNAHVCQFVEVPVATAVVPMCPPPFILPVCRFSIPGRMHAFWSHLVSKQRILGDS